MYLIFRLTDMAGRKKKERGKTERNKGLFLTIKIILGDTDHKTIPETYGGEGSTAIQY